MTAQPVTAAASGDIQLVNLEAQHAPIRAELDRAMRGVMDANAFILGPELKAFEDEAARYLGVAHAIGCGNGSDALYLALRALGVKAGDEVVTVPHTYVATPEAAAHAGARVVFCDVDPVSFNMDPARLKAAMTPRTKAIIAVDIFGQCADYEAINRIANGIPVVQDMAQAWGAQRNGHKAGAHATVACISFYPTKTLGACGDGGMIATSDAALAERLRSLRVHGESRRYHNAISGVNSRLDAIQAAVLRVKLRHVDAWNAGRRRVAEYYAARFEGTPVVAPRVAPGNVHVWHQYTVLVERRDELMAHLHKRGIGCGVYYPIPQHLQECFAHLGYKRGDFPVSEMLSERGLSIPCWPEMSEAQMARVADELLAFFGV